MARYPVARADEIPPGGRKIVFVANRSIGVFNINGEFYAVRNQCPHAGGPLCEGGLGGLTRSTEPGKFDYLRAGEFIRCPWHSWEFDIKTGQSWFDPRKVRVRAFKASVACGGELVEARQDEGLSETRAQGPFTVETYPVLINEEYVVLEI